MKGWIEFSYAVLSQAIGLKIVKLSGDSAGILRDLRWPICKWKNSITSEKRKAGQSLIPMQYTRANPNLYVRYHYDQN